MLKALVNYSPYNDEVYSHAWTHSPIRHRCREVNGNFDMLTMGEGFAIARAVKKVTSEYHIPLSETEVKEIQGLLSDSTRKLKHGVLAGRAIKGDRTC